MSHRDMDEVDKLVAERVLYSREKAGLTQIDLGKKLGISFQQVQKYERGKNRITAGRLYAIAEACNVPIETMFEPIPVEAETA